MTTGEKIRYYRNLRGMSQETLGELSGIHYATIKKYELGIRNPKPEQLLKISNALGISLDNKELNKRLCKYLETKELLNTALEKYQSGSIDEKQKKELEDLEKTIDEIKQSLIDSNLVIRKGTSGITVKIPQI